jgi:RND superfamily putative drug exporter
MALLDARAWWMPRWLEPIVPHLQLEGSTTPAAPEPAAPARTKTAADG